MKMGARQPQKSFMIFVLSATDSFHWNPPVSWLRCWKALSPSPSQMADPAIRWGESYLLLDLLWPASDNEFERSELPKAVANGWPQQINWEFMSARVLALEDLIYGIFFDENGARLGCVFWGEFLAAAADRKAGDHRNVMAQFATFHNWRPGYYGERGAQLIQRVLYAWFLPTPESRLDHITSPLSVTEFIERILVPEVGLRLIAEDWGLDLGVANDMLMAKGILRESSSYGGVMFPADDFV
ncbi:RTC4-like domain-containing protein [Favolaschia claudopus]|uniref:Restriction of telomere capping protein 4 n=1 Tax=Favolaschia claudopus TaxID=2862362 RepID=A0AAW0CQT0_9AGAR